MIFPDEKCFKLPFREHNSALLYSTSSIRSQNRVGPGIHFDQKRENIRCGWTQKEPSTILPSSRQGSAIPIHRLRNNNSIYEVVRDGVLIYQGRNSVREIKQRPGPGQYNPQIDYWNKKSFNSRISTSRSSQRRPNSSTI